MRSRCRTSRRRSAGATRHASALGSSPSVGTSSTCGAGREDSNFNRRFWRPLLYQLNHCPVAQPVRTHPIRARPPGVGMEVQTCERRRGKTGRADGRARRVPGDRRGSSGRSRTPGDPSAEVPAGGVGQPNQRRIGERPVDHDPPITPATVAAPLPAPWAARRHHAAGTRTWRSPPSSTTASVGEHPRSARFGHLGPPTTSPGCAALDSAGPAPAGSAGSARRGRVAEGRHDRGSRTWQRQQTTQCSAAGFLGDREAASGADW